MAIDTNACREIQLDRVSGSGGAAYISITANVNSTGTADVPCREVYIQGAAANSTRVFVNLFATAAVTAGIVIPRAYLSASDDIMPVAATFALFPVSCLSAINCFATAAAAVNIVWRR